MKQTATLADLRAARQDARRQNADTSLPAASRNPAGIAAICISARIKYLESTK